MMDIICNLQHQIMGMEENVCRLGFSKMGFLVGGINVYIYEASFQLYEKE